MVKTKDQESSGKQERFYIEVEVNACNDKIREIQDLVVEAFPQYADYRRKVSYPHITIIHFTLTDQESIEEITEAVSQGITWPHSFQLKLDMLEQFRDGGIHLTFSKPNEINKLHDEMNRVLMTNGVCVNKIEKEYHPHLSIFHRQDSPKELEEAWGFKELITNDKLLIVQEVMTIRMIKQRDYFIQHVWELMSLANKLMDQHYCLMVTNEEVMMRRDVINDVVMQHNVALLTLRSKREIKADMVRGGKEQNRSNGDCQEDKYSTQEGIYNTNVQQTTCQNINRDTIDPESERDKLSKDKRNTETGWGLHSPVIETEPDIPPSSKMMNKICMIESNLAENDIGTGETEDEALRGGDRNDEAKEEVRMQEMPTEDKREKDIDKDHQCSDIGEENMGNIEDRRYVGQEEPTSGKEEEYSDENPNPTIEGYNTRTSDIKNTTRRTAMEDHTWNHETMKQIKETKLLYNPLRYTFRKGLRIGSIVIAFIYKTLSRSPQRQKQLLDNIKYTTNVTLIQNIVTEKDWAEGTQRTKEVYASLKWMMEGIKLIRTNHQLKEKGSEGMKGMNESHDNLEVLKREIGEFKRKFSESNKYLLNKKTL